MGATSAAIVTAVFPPHERGRALGINVMAVYIGLTVGPPLGGFIVDAVGWRWIFLINIPIGIVVLLLGWFMLPRTEGVKGGSAARRGRFRAARGVPDLPARAADVLARVGMGFAVHPRAAGSSRRRRSSRS